MSEDSLFPDLVFQKPFKRFGEDIETEYRCPKCHHEWSGEPKAGGDRQVVPDLNKSGVVSERVVKPPYKVPSMEEIAKIKATNGLCVVSTFSGCGGSCLGFEMAGYKVLWASEFINAAAETYVLNHEGVILDTRDIREVTPEEILEKIGKKPGEIDVLEGSPPCASFSTAGKKEAGWGKVRKYSDKKQRTDDLFFEYARILKGLQPKVFVAENVSGLVKGTAKGYFLEILGKLKDCGYYVEARLLDASKLGVPQARQRVIFLGVRNDIGKFPIFPEPLPYEYTVRDALPWIVKHGTAPPHEDFAKNDRSIDSTMVDSDEPSPTIMASGENKGVGWVDAMIGERAIHDTSGQFSQGDVTDRPAPTVTADVVGHLFVEKEADISRFAIGEEWVKLREGEKSEKYLNLMRANRDKPCPTVTASGGHGGTASVTHPIERRKFSILELKRICGFPDDFRLTGSYQNQWERLGRSVPPVMMMEIAKTIKEKILCAG